jgi:hypothetical protein
MNTPTVQQAYTTGQISDAIIDLEQGNYSVEAVTVAVKILGEELHKQANLCLETLPENLYDCVHEQVIGGRSIQGRWARQIPLLLVRLHSR